MVNVERAKNLFVDITWLLLVAVALLIIGIPYAFAFLAIGGGWAYYGAGDCHFEIGPIGYVMLVPPIVVLAGVVWLARRYFRSG